MAQSKVKTEDNKSPEKEKSRRNDKKKNRYKNRKKRPQYERRNKSSKFKGAIDGMKGYVFEMFAEGASTVQFTRTCKNLDGYVL